MVADLMILKLNHKKTKTLIDSGALLAESISYPV